MKRGEAEIIGDYKIYACECQRISAKTFEGIGRKWTEYAVYKMGCPFPNKTIKQWIPLSDLVKGCPHSYKSYKEAREMVDSLIAEQKAI